MTPAYRLLFLLFVLLPVANQQLLSDELPSSERGEDPTSDRSLIVELTAYGRGGHGSSLNPSSAPHRLIRALTRIERWSQARSVIDESGTVARRDSKIARIEVLSVQAGKKINVTPDQATAQLLLAILPGVVSREIVEELSLLLENQVDLQVVGSNSAK